MNNNTSYQPLQAFGNSDSNYWGGIIKFWYAPIEYLNGFPLVNPTNQKLISQPSLIAGRNWLGAVEVPNDSVGYEEVAAYNSAGVFYKRKLQFFENGLSADKFNNVANSVYHQLCVVALVRSGLFYIVIGNNESGLKVDLNASTGVGPLGMPGNKLVLSDENISRAFVLPSFTP